MGIRNVARRLRLLYDDRAALTIRTDERGQTVAAFSIPAARAGAGATDDNKAQPETTHGSNRQ